MVQQVVTAPAAAALPGSDVRDISANSVIGGVLFGGRNEALAVKPGTPSTVLAAIELGGVWLSTNSGANWSHVDSLPLTAMDDVQFAPTDANLVVATGEYDGNSATKNAEVYVSTNGGTTWTRATTTTCGGNARSSHKVSFGAGAPGSVTVFVATDCGLIRSTNSGTTWTNVNPNGVGNQFWDVKVRGAGPNFTVDTCGASGFFRSTNGGTTFVQNAGALGGTGFLPCRIATAPTNAAVVFLASFSGLAANGLCLTQLLESDNGGGAFTNLNPTSDTNCRPANVKTAPGFDSVAAHFEVFFATDSNWVHERCDLGNLTLAVPTTACPIGNGSNGGSFSDYDSSIAAVHNAPDASDLAFNTASPSCPFLSSGDGGVFSTANGCANSPTFTQSNVGMHGLQATGHAGSSYTGHTDLYFSTQDNGIWNTTNAGGTWREQGPDVFGVFADQDGPPSQVVYKECCFVSGSSVTAGLFQNNEAMTSQSGLTSPPGLLPAFGNILGAQFGNQRYALLTSTGAPTNTWRVYVTTNSGGTWTQMGPDLPAGSNPRQLVASGPAATPTFYLLNRVGGAASVSRLTGPLNGTATFTAVGGGLTSPSLIAVSPTDPRLLYAEDDGGVPAMKRSVDSGVTFAADTLLTALVTSGAQYSLPGFVSAIGIDGNSNTVLVGTTDNGIFATNNFGGAWAQIRGSVQVSRSVGFFFDEKTGLAYTASAGRAEWEITLPNTITTLTSSPNPSDFGAPVTFTATVTPSPSPGSGAPTGTVTFIIDGTPVATVPLDGANPGHAIFTTSGLGPGSHTVVARYNGDAFYFPSTSAPLIQVVTCAHSITGNTGSLTLAPDGTGASWCLSRVNSSGSITVQPGAAVAIDQSSAAAGITSNGAKALRMCSVRVFSGTLTVTNSTGFVLVGDPGDDHCAGSSVSGPALFSGNTAGVEIGNSSFYGLTVNTTQNVGAFPEDDRAEIEANRVVGNLSCTGNVPPATNGAQPNMVTGTRSGQCSAAGF